MAQALDNVIAFNQARATGGAARKRNVSVESAGVINGCRDMALTRICAALSDAFNKIEDELFELATKSADREAQNMYLDARNQAREKRKDIESAFRSQFMSFFDEKMAGKVDAPVEKTAHGRYNLDQLSLVGDDTLTEDIAVNDISKRLNDKCDEELRALSQRMGFLLSEPELADEANPISPDTVVRALKAACDQMTSGFQTKLTVLKMMEQHMAEEMLSVYRDINTHLIAKQIMPTIRPTFRKAQTHVVRKGGVSAGAGATQDEVIAGGEIGGNTGGAGDRRGSASGEFAQNIMGMGGVGGVMPGNSAAEIFHTLQQLMSGGTNFGAMNQGVGEYKSVTTGSFAPVPPGSAGATATNFAPNFSAQSNQGNSHGHNMGAIFQAGAPSPADATNAPNVGVTSDALIAALSQMQQQWMKVGAASTNASPNGATDAGANATTAASFNAIRNFVPGETSVADLNVLRSIKAQGISQGSNQVDTMTIDIVAMLFDYVFDDKSIPDTIKALIARLQIPVLKVAILDKAFFSKKSHPVRRLLDTLADASVAFAGEASREDPLYKKIEVIVDRVHGEFDTDVTLFEQMIVEFEEFLRARETANADIIEQSARAMHEREKREMARLVAQAECEQRANQADLPAPVAAILKGPWSRVLERVYLRDGGRNARFLEVVETAEQLVWSVTPKADASQRRDLVAALPLLLRRLQEGLDIASVEKDDRDRFFSALVDCHAAAVKAGLRGESVASLFAAAHRDEAVAPLFEKLIAEERAREAAAANINRSGVARIQFTDKGVEIEEVIATKDGAATSVVSETETTATENDGYAFSSASDNVDDSIPPAELKRGTWVEFIHDAGKQSKQKIRAKLSWVSPLKGVYLFTNPGANEALSIAPDALHRQLRQGAARIIEGSSMIDRAVDRMVNSLSGGLA
jgi:Protein of unknown function (DUF1631)